MRRAGIVGVLVAVAVAASLLSTGCTTEAADKPLKPTVQPPVIGKAGTLRAVVDTSIPPFGGSVASETVGLDIDVASAVAERLGLKLELIETTPTAGAVLLREGGADIMLGALRIDEAVQADVAFAGPYLNDAPSVFSTVEATHTLQTIAGMRIAAQVGSLAYWRVADEYGDEMVTPCPTLAAAFTAVENGEADVAVGDGVVGVYMQREHPKMLLNGQLEPAVPVGIAVSKDANELEQAVRDVLDDLSSTGVLETLRRKWLGDSIRFVGSADASGTPEATEPVDEAAEVPAEVP